jgi:hypothetical protein
MGGTSIAEIETKLLEYFAGESKNGAGSAEGIVQTEAASRPAHIKEFLNEMLSILPERQRSVLADRYGLWDGIAETLQDIGDKLGLTRERIRQIEANGLKRIRRRYKYAAIRRYILEKIRSYIEADKVNGCGIISEDEAVSALAIECTAEEVELALAFLQDIDTSGRTVFAHNLIEIGSGVYCIDEGIAGAYHEMLRTIELTLKAKEKPLTENFLRREIASRTDSMLTPERLQLAKRIVSLSSRICRLRNGTLALSQWTEFRAHDAPQLAEAALRLLGRPAHFREITEKANAIAGETRPLNERTVHGAMLRKAEKFVWVKSGTYGLAAWGLKKPPFAKDRLVELLSETGYPLPLWHLEQKVLEVCNCKLGSIRMTLDLNPKLFMKFEGDQYGLRQHYTK